jgi:hypothetical protein
MSKYEGDSRVVLRSDDGSWPPDLAAVIPAHADDESPWQGEWQVRRNDRGEFEAHNVSSGPADVDGRSAWHLSQHRLLIGWPTLDDALYALLGEPQVTA